MISSPLDRATDVELATERPLELRSDRVAGALTLCCGQERGVAATEAAVAAQRFPRPDLRNLTIFVVYWHGGNVRNCGVPRTGHQLRPFGTGLFHGCREHL